MEVETHTRTITGTTSQDTAIVNVPAEEQRKQRICIDDTIEVTIKGLKGLFSSISFTNPQVAGDNVTVPAEVVRKADIEHGERYEMMFERIEEEEQEDEAEGLEDEEFAIPDEEIEEDIEEEADDLEQLLDELEESSDSSDSEHSGLFQ